MTTKRRTTALLGAVALTLGVVTNASVAQATPAVPGPVTNVVASSSTTTITLTWTAPGSPYTAVTVGMNAGDTAPTASNTGDTVKNVAKPANSVTFSGLQPGPGFVSPVDYSFALYARNGASTYSIPVTVTQHTAPPKPTVTHTITSTSITLNITTACEQFPRCGHDSYLARYALGTTAPTLNSGEPFPLSGTSGQPSTAVLRQLQPGTTYTVSVWDAYFNNSYSDPTVVHFKTVAAASGGTITGRVTRAGIGKAENADVYVYQSGHFITNARTDSQGGYSVTLNAAGRYAVCAYPEDVIGGPFQITCSGDTHSKSTATSFTVDAAHAAVTRNIIVPSGSTTAAGEFTGRVTDSSGTPLQDVIAVLYIYPREGFPSDVVTGDVTADDGTFSLTAPDTTNLYLVCAEDGDDSPPVFAGPYGETCAAPSVAPTETHLVLPVRA